MLLEYFETFKKIDIVITYNEKIEIFFELKDFIKNIENKSKNLYLFGGLIKRMSFYIIGNKLIELGALDFFVDLLRNFNFLKR